MEKIERILSRPTAKPYRSEDIDPSETLHLDENGSLDFSPNDIENPKNWSAARRWYITAVVVFLTVNATFASSSPSGCLQSISEQFQVSEEASGLVITLFLLGYCFGPLFFAPLSEFYGRRYVFYITFSIYLVFNFLCAFTPTFAGLLIGRFLTGAFVSAPLSNCPGVLYDVWGPVERGQAMAFFSMATFFGPAIGPIVSGFLELKKDWRWSFYVLIWLGAFTEILMFTLPETMPPIVLLNKAKRIRKMRVPGHERIQAPVEASGQRDLKILFKVALIRPWKILMDPISFLIAIYVSIVYALLYMLFIIYPIVFQEKRHWNSGVGELPLLGTVLGALLGGSIILAISVRDRKRLVAGIPSCAEDRLPVAMFGGVMFAITMFWFAWSAEYNSVHWIVPCIAGVFLNMSIVVIFVAYLNYLTDTYMMYTASAMAANAICRSACGAAAPLFTKYMFDALGVGGGGSLIGGVACLLAPIPFVFYKYGEQIRRKSKFAPTEDKPPVRQEDIESNSGAASLSEKSAKSNSNEGGSGKEYDAGEETEEAASLSDSSRKEIEGK